MNVPANPLAIGASDALRNCADYLRDEQGLTQAAEQIEAVEAAFGELIAADREYDAAIEALVELNRKIAVHGWMEIQHDALRTAGERLVRAQSRRADAIARMGGDA